MQSEQAKGLIFALLGFMTLSIGDGVIKTIDGAWPGPAVAALRYAFATFGLGVILAFREGRAGFSVPEAGLQISRGLCVGLATIAFFMGLFLMPMAEVTSITFTTPMLTAMISAVLLKERISRATWLATLVAFIGVLVVLRPNLLEIGVAALLPLVAALCMSVLMLLNRKVAGTASVLALQFFVAAFAVPFMIGIVVAGHYSGVPALQIAMPDWTIIARCAVVAVTATCAHTLIFLATVRASAATVAPMSYAQLLVALVFGFLAFGEVPDAKALGGGALIIGSGLFLWWTQNRRLAAP